MNAGARPVQLSGKVLIAEDNPAMRFMLATLCREWGVEVVECENGAEAVAAFAQHRPDWVLMDFAMPVMGGVAATARIKAQFPEARIVIVSEYDSEGLRQAAFDAGTVGCVGKEDLSQLAEILGAEGGCRSAEV